MLATKSFNISDKVTTGGTEAVYNESNIYYKVHRFLSVGTSTFKIIGTKIFGLDILVVGGGGSGVGGSGGAGGGGVVIYGTGIDLTDGEYTVVVGSGGIVSKLTTVSVQHSVAGSQSSITYGGTTYHALGGGGGGGEGSLTAKAGGNGGGAGEPNGIVTNTAQTNHTGYTEYANNNGGACNQWPYGGGGGGAGAVGGASVSGSRGGHGGNGQQVGTIYDGSTNYYWGGGGGGSGYSGTAGNGGSGGGGAGGRGGSGSAAGTQGANGINTASFPSSTEHGSNGAANTGGGGGAGNDSGYGGDGGSGIVVVRYRIN